MSTKKTLHERERELQVLLGSNDGQKELSELASKYEAESGKPRPHGTSVITYLLVHERGRGLIEL